MGGLNAFLNPSEKLKIKEITVSNRFKNEDGSLATIKIRQLSQIENDQLIKRCMKQSIEKGIPVERLDNLKYKDEFLMACIVEPNFRDPKFPQAMNCVDPIDAMKKCFTAAEYNKILSEAMDINDTELDSVKN